MPLPSRTDFARSAFTAVWLVVAVATLSWKAPWFWTAPSVSTPPSPSASVPEPDLGTEPLFPPMRPPSAVRDDVHRPSPRIEVLRTSREVAPAPAAPNEPVETLDAALARHEAAARQDPLNPSTLAALAQIYEATGRFDDASDTYRRIERAAGPLGPAAQLRLARVLRWAGHPDEAVAAYSRYLAIAPDAAPEAVGELGLALVESGRPADALAHLERGMAQSPAREDLYIAHARAASDLSQPARAAATLVRLSALRRLTTDEAMWLAGQLDESSDVDRGMAAIYAALDAAPGGSAALWERTGDLEVSRGRFADALSAYDQVPAGCDQVSALTKRARAAGQAGRPVLASQLYEQAIACTPGNGPLLLETARFHGTGRAPDRAVAYYVQYADHADPGPDQFLEMAQTALAAGQPALALEWADAAIAGGGRAPAIAYARAQALQLLERPREAEAEFAALVRHSPRDGALLAWQGRAASAQGRHLAAFNLFDAALAAGVPDRPGVLVARSDAAASRGDFRRARRGYDLAHAAAANPEVYDIDGRLQSLSRRTQPQVVLPGEFFTDSNGVSIAQAGAALVIWPGSLGRLRARWSTGAVEQGLYRFTRRAAGIVMDEIFPRAAVRLDVGAGVEDYGAATIPVWSVQARRDLTTTGFVALQVARQTPWSSEIRVNGPRYNRIADLQDVGPAFHSTGVRAVSELPVRRHGTLLVDAGWQQHSDANRQMDLYAHFQREVASRGDGSLWVALQPQIYVEHWTERRAAYFSPAAHLGVGAGIRLHASTGGWSFEGAATPQLLSGDGRNGLGVFGSAAAGRLLGRVWVGGEAALFSDRRHDYRWRRMAVEIRVPLR